MNAIHMRKVIYTILLITLATTIQAQNTKMDYANRAYNKHLYTTAIKLYKKVLDKRPNYKIPKIRIADCYRQLDQWHEAELWYGKLIVDAKRPDEKQLLHYIQALQTNGKYEVALEWLEVLLEIDTAHHQGQLMYNACLIDTVEKYTEDFLELYDLKAAPFNSEKDDFSPILQSDGSALFSRGQTGRVYNWYVPVYEPYKLEFFQVKNLTKDGSTPKFNKKLRKFGAFSAQPRASSATISNDELQAMYIKYDRKFCGKNHPNLIPYKIFTAQKQRNLWGYHLPFDYNADEYTCTHPTLSEDGQTIIFASDMPGGFGGMDLYSISFDEGQWTEPKNLGASINSTQDEVFPYIHYSTGMLYFSSNGHGGMGGFDIFWTSKTLKKTWHTPQHFGAPINSPWNDYNIFINRDDNFGFISSDRKGGKGGVDIYTFERLD